MNLREATNPPAAGARLYSVGPDRRFRDSDRAVLDLMRLHSPQFRRNAVARRHRVLGPSNGAAGLSPPEREILELVAQGLTNARVARRLWISPGTARKHLENAYEELDVHTRLEQWPRYLALPRQARGRPPGVLLRRRQPDTGAPRRPGRPTRTAVVLMSDWCDGWRAALGRFDSCAAARPAVQAMTPSRAPEGRPGAVRET
jgi:DNA-binding CsgD family transcriptional regulator